jgi:hypothetical protein
MPSVDNSRISTPTGEIDYAEDDATANASTTSSSSLNSSSTTNPDQTISGLNIGGGYGVFAGTNGQYDVVMEFKTLIPGVGIELIQDASTITIKNVGQSSGNGTIIGDGFDIDLGDSNTVVWSGGALPFTNTTVVSEAIDDLNKLLALLVPSAPPAFPNANALVITNTTGSTPYLCSGVTNNSGTTAPTAGTAINRITTTGATSNVFNDMGPGNSGTIQLRVNGAVANSHVMTGTGDNGNYGGLLIADQKDFPVATPGFYKSVDVSALLAAAPFGLNRISLNHTGAGATADVFFVRDAMTSMASLNSSTVTEAALGTVAYSSSVPHYNTGASLTVGTTATNISGDTYYGGTDPLVISSPVIASQSFAYGTLGITTPITKDLTTATISPVTVNIDGTGHTSGVIQGSFKNVNGASTLTTLSPTTVLIKRGSAGSRIDEMSVPVSGLGSSPNTNNALRVGQAAGDTPAGSPAAWVSSASIATHEAAVVAGILKHDQTNYSVNYLPVGPDLSSGRSGAQYVTFSFNRATVSTFKIAITGNYAGCWIKLPGVSDNNSISPNAANGWWNMSQSYIGAGVPGGPGDTNAGCAVGSVMTGSTGTYTVTFGTQTSTNATGNQILVRIRLNAGQTISALAFTN